MAQIKNRIDGRNIFINSRTLPIRVVIGNRFYILGVDDNNEAHLILDRKPTVEVKS